jgi:hypothetical protein
MTLIVRPSTTTAMCVLLCANPKVHEWLDFPLALAHRQALELSTLCANGWDAKPGEHMDEATARRVMKRSAWLQAYCKFHSQLAQRRQSSSQDWQKALEVLANAWGRLLSLVGLRW